ncbi:MAG TPA: gluconokinase [Ramlibacter sp.]|uniref:gluconokinase n=1 Tax=Ramlibacter sp. TaxID=1917967 RepID=UPI002C52D896|nr:gluconokinase [Ramlibacter sp.]HVZ44900.1 gluconokinase [Ramlibacter sp.]
MAKIVVMGVAGSGKSLLAESLAKRLGYPMVEGDDYHLPASQEKMRAGVALEDSDREPWLARVGELMAAHEGGIVVACSALKRKYRDQLRSHVPDLKFVYIEIDVHTAARRVGSRSGHLFPTSLVTSQFVALESPVGEPGVLEVSALATPQAQVDAVAQWLAADRSESPRTKTPA